MPDARVDHFLDGALRLRQTARGHRAGTDAVLLAAAIAAPKGRALDLGAGVGPVGLMLAARAPALDMTLVEIDAQSAALARGNIALNGFSSRARVLEADALSARARRAAGLADADFDLVVCNPPWLPPGRARASPDARRALAHVATRPVGDWIKAMAALAKPRGRMALIAPADALREALDACQGRFGDVAVLPVHPRAGAAAIRIVMAGKKGSRAAARLMPGLILHGDSGGFTPLAEDLHRGRATLDLA